MSNSFNVNGRVRIIKDTQVVGDKGFTKRDLIVSCFNDEQYPQSITFQVTGDRVNLLDKFQVNDEVKISFALKGRETTKDGQTNAFTNLDAWKIELVERPKEHDPFADDFKV